MLINVLPHDLGDGTTPVPRPHQQDTLTTRGPWEEDITCGGHTLHACTHNILVLCARTLMQQHACTQRRKAAIRAYVLTGGNTDTCIFMHAYRVDRHHNIITHPMHAFCSHTRTRARARWHPQCCTYSEATTHESSRPQHKCGVFLFVHLPHRTPTCTCPFSTALILVTVNLGPFGARGIHTVSILVASFHCGGCVVVSTSPPCTSLSISLSF